MSGGGIVVTIFIVVWAGLFGWAKATGRIKGGGSGGGYGGGCGSSCGGGCGGGD